MHKDIYHYLSCLPQYSHVGTKAINYSLDRILEFSCRIGSPHLALSYIHVAGTNGKGTVCHQLASVYQAEEYKVGLFTSPHLERFQERIKVGGKEISDYALQFFFKQWGSLVKEIPLSYFELMTIIGLWYFTQKQVDIAIIEAGLGGRLDATNIIQPKATIITSISLDHTDILGDSLEQISREKAGIIKRETPVILGDIPPSCLDIFTKAAKINNSPVHTVFPSGDYSSISKIHGLSPKGDIPGLILCNTQIINMAITQAAVKYIPLPVRENIFQSQDFTSLMKTIYLHKGVWYCLDYLQLWFYDGAHNIKALTRLFEQMETIVPLEQWTLVIGIMKDKIQSHYYLHDKYRLFNKIFYLQLKGKRAATLEDVKNIIPIDNILSPLNGFSIDLLTGKKWVMFTGSLYLYDMIKK